MEEGPAVNRKPVGRERQDTPTKVTPLKGGWQSTEEEDALLETLTVLPFILPLRRPTRSWVNL